MIFFHRFSFKRCKQSTGICHVVCHSNVTTKIFISKKMEEYLSSCRVCLCFIKEPKLEQDCNDNDAKVKPEIKFFFEKTTNFKLLPEEPQNCCSYCYSELMQFIQFLEKCERTQIVLDGLRHAVETKSEPFPLNIPRESKDEKRNEQEVPKKRRKKMKGLETPSDKLLKVICPYCANLVKSSYLELHIKTVHMEPRNTYFCDICSTQLSSKKSVIRHMNNIHLKIQKYKCNICTTEFPNESLRKMHLMQIHNVIPPKECPYCDYRAFTKAHITRHIQRHRGDRRFKCSVCSFAFVTLYQLQTHEAVHSDERNFECNECLKRFKTKKSLGAHKKSHLPYEYECEVCSRSFLTNQMMRIHVTKSHPHFELPPPGTILNKNKQALRKKSIKLS